MCRPLRLLVPQEPLPSPSGAAESPLPRGFRQPRSCPPCKMALPLWKECLAHLNMCLLCGLAFPLLGEVNTCPQGH